MAAALKLMFIQLGVPREIFPDQGVIFLAS